MTQTLIERIRAARAMRVPAGGWTFDVRRPTAFEVTELSAQESHPYRLACRCVAGWDVNERDVVPGGDGAPIAFSPELFAEWAADHPEIWSPIAEAIIAAFNAHREVLDAATGK